MQQLSSSHENRHVKILEVAVKLKILITELVTLWGVDSAVQKQECVQNTQILNRIN